jgi:hypothetical protein
MSIVTASVSQSGVDSIRVPALQSPYLQKAAEQAGFSSLETFVDEQKSINTSHPVSQLFSRLTYKYTMLPIIHSVAKSFQYIVISNANYHFIAEMIKTYPTKTILVCCENEEMDFLRLMRHEHASIPEEETPFEIKQAIEINRKISNLGPAFREPHVWDEAERGCTVEESATFLKAIVGLGEPLCELVEIQKNKILNGAEEAAIRAFCTMSELVIDMICEHTELFVTFAGRYAQRFQPVVNEALGRWVAAIRELQPGEMHAFLEAHEIEINVGLGEVMDAFIGCPRFFECFVAVAEMILETCLVADGGESWGFTEMMGWWNRGVPQNETSTFASALTWLDSVTVNVRMHFTNLLRNIFSCNQCTLDTFLKVMAFAYSFPSYISLFFLGHSDFSQGKREPQYCCYTPISHSKEGPSQILYSNCTMEEGILKMLEAAKDTGHKVIGISSHCGYYWDERNTTIYKKGATTIQQVLLPRCIEEAKYYQISDWRTVDEANGFIFEGSLARICCQPFNSENVESRAEKTYTGHGEYWYEMFNYVTGMGYGEREFHSCLGSNNVIICTPSNGNKEKFKVKECSPMVRIEDPRYFQECAPVRRLHSETFSLEMLSTTLRNVIDSAVSNAYTKKVPGFEDTRTLDQIISEEGVGGFHKMFSCGYFVSVRHSLSVAASKIIVRTYIKNMLGFNKEHNASALTPKQQTMLCTMLVAISVEVLADSLFMLWHYDKKVECLSLKRTWSWVKHTFWSNFKNNFLNGRASPILSSFGLANACRKFGPELGVTVLGEVVIGGFEIETMRRAEYYRPPVPKQLLYHNQKELGLFSTTSGVELSIDVEALSKEFVRAGRFAIPAYSKLLCDVPYRCAKSVCDLIVKNLGLNPRNANVVPSNVMSIGSLFQWLSQLDLEFIMVGTGREEFYYKKLHRERGTRQVMFFEVETKGVDTVEQGHLRLYANEVRVGKNENRLIVGEAIARGHSIEERYNSCCSYVGNERCAGDEEFAIPEAADLEEWSIYETQQVRGNGAMALIAQSENFLRWAQGELAPINCTVVKGYPGTGKTFAIEQFLEEETEEVRGRTIYLAPTRERVDHFAEQFPEVNCEVFKGVQNLHLPDGPLTIVFDEGWGIEGVHLKWIATRLSALHPGSHVYVCGDPNQVCAFRMGDQGNRMDRLLEVDRYRGYTLRVTHRFSAFHCSRLQGFYPGIVSAVEGRREEWEVKPLGEYDANLEGTVLNLNNNDDGIQTVARVQGNTYEKMHIIVQGNSFNIPANHLQVIPHFGVAASRIRAGGSITWYVDANVMPAFNQMFEEIRGAFVAREHPAVPMELEVEQAEPFLVNLLNNVVLNGSSKNRRRNARERKLIAKQKVEKELVTEARKQTPDSEVIRIEHREVSDERVKSTITRVIDGNIKVDSAVMDSKAGVLENIPCGTVVLNEPINFSKFQSLASEPRDGCKNVLTRELLDQTEQVLISQFGVASIPVSEGQVVTGPSYANPVKSHVKKGVVNMTVNMARLETVKFSSMRGGGLLTRRVFLQSHRSSNASHNMFALYERGSIKNFRAGEDSAIPPAKLNRMINFTVNTMVKHEKIFPRLKVVSSLLESVGFEQLNLHIAKRAKSHDEAPNEVLEGDTATEEMRKVLIDIERVLQPLGFANEVLKSQTKSVEKTSREKFEWNKKEQKMNSLRVKKFNEYFKSSQVTNLQKGQTVCSITPEQTKIPELGSFVTRVLFSCMEWVMSDLVVQGGTAFCPSSNAPAAFEQMRDPKHTLYVGDAVSRDATFSKFDIDLLKKFSHNKTVPPLVRKLFVNFANYFDSNIKNCKVRSVDGIFSVRNKYRMLSGLPCTFRMNTFKTIYEIFASTMCEVTDEEGGTYYRSKSKVTAILAAGDDSAFTLQNPVELNDCPLSGVVFWLKLQKVPKNAPYLFCKSVVSKGQVWPLIPCRLAKFLSKEFAPPGKKEVVGQLKEFVESFKQHFGNIKGNEDFVCCISANLAYYNWVAKQEGMDQPIITSEMLQILLRCCLGIRDSSVNHLRNLLNKVEFVSGVKAADEQFR